MVHTTGNPDSRSHKPKYLKDVKDKEVQKTLKRFPYSIPNNVFLLKRNKKGKIIDIDSRSKFIKEYPNEYKAVDAYSMIQQKRKQKPLKNINAILIDNITDKIGGRESAARQVTMYRKYKGKRIPQKVIILPKEKVPKQVQDEYSIYRSTHIAHEDAHANEKRNPLQPISEDVKQAEKKYKLTPEEASSAYHSLTGEQHAYNKELQYTKYLQKRTNKYKSKHPTKAEKKLHQALKIRTEYLTQII